MSLIFDALQRAEAERLTANGEPVREITDLLRMVEDEIATKKALVTGQDSEPATSTIYKNIIAGHDLLNSNQPRASERDQVLLRCESVSIDVSAREQLISWADVGSLAAEKFKFLGVRLRHLRRDHFLKKILITSTIPKEGKSTVAANLAYVLTQKENQRVLLLEGDVRRPSLSGIFGLEGKPGLCDLLENGNGDIDHIYRWQQHNLWIMPAGNAPDNPLDLLQSNRLPVLIEQAAATFDWIVIDSPPVLPLADTSIWSRLADGILVIARQGTTQKKQLLRGLETLDQKKLIGALLNSSQTSSENNEYYYYRRSHAKSEV